MDKLLVIGAGLTGSFTSFLLRNSTAAVEIWEKSRGAGGRMSTSRNPLGGAGIADVGAQYVTATQAEYDANKSIYEELLERGLLSPMTGIIEGDRRPADGTRDFITPSGINSMVKHFLNQSGANVSYNTRVADVSVQGEQWRVTSEAGAHHVVDAVILTIPVPQVMQLQGDIRDIIDKNADAKSKLEAVQYSSRYALGLFYEPGTQIDVPWCAKYIDGDDCVRFVAIDNKKRGKESPDEGPSVVVHTSVPFGVKHVEENPDTVCKDIVLPRVLQLVPQLPKPAAVKPQKWRYSQVSTPFEGQPGAVVLHSKPLLICAGDAFVKSGFNGCLKSAQSSCSSSAINCSLSYL